MYATDRGLDRLESEHGEESFAVAWLTDRLRVFTDLHPQHEDAVDAVSRFLSAEADAEPDD